MSIELRDFSSLKRIPRAGSPRAKSEVKAKVVHTAGNGRSLYLFISGPVQMALGWKVGSAVDAAISVSSNKMRLIPAHAGYQLTRAYKKSKTARICLSGTFLVPGTCARVRPVPFECDDHALTIALPPEWLMADIRARAEKQVAK